MKNLIAAVDFSEIAPAVLAKAEELARATHSKLWLIHVASPEPDFLGYQTGPQTERDFMARQFHQEHCQLQKWAKNLRHRGIDVVALLIQGGTVETILEEAKKLEADLIVVGSHGRSGLSKIWLGSVSEEILRQTHCPVLIVPYRCAVIPNPVK